MIRTLSRFWQILQLEEGQDVAEYAVMLAVILAVVVGTIRIIGSGASNVFSLGGEYYPVNFDAGSTTPILVFIRRRQFSPLFPLG